MSEDNKNSKWKNTVKYYVKSDITKVVLIILCLLVLAIGVTSLINSGIEENITLVISFFGILATFIVISNYSQISETKSETNRKIIQHDIRINEREKQLKEQVANQIKDSEEKVFKSMNEATEEFVEMRRFLTTPNGDSLMSLLNIQFGEFKQQSEEFSKEQADFQKRQSYIIRAIMYLIIGEHRELILAMLQNQKYSCRVKHAGKNHFADAYREGDNIVFNIEGKIQTTDVSHVNGTIYEKDIMTKFMHTINSMQKTQE